EPAGRPIEDGVRPILDRMPRKPPQHARVEPAGTIGLDELEGGERGLGRHRQHRAEWGLEDASREDGHGNRAPQYYKQRHAVDAWHARTLKHAAGLPDELAGSWRGTRRADISGTPFGG